MRGDGRNQLQIPAPLPLKEIFRMIPPSAQPISLDSPFKYIEEVCPAEACSYYSTLPLQLSLLLQFWHCYG
jgi:hypothetical protein